MILTLVVIGGKAIKHFSDYGCLGRMSIAGEGVDFVPVPANSCPKLPSRVSKQEKTQSLGIENDPTCWKMLFANGGNSDYYPNCIMSDPTFQLGVILACTVPFYAIRKRLVASYNSEAFEQARANFMFGIMHAENGHTSFTENFDNLAEQLGKENPTDVVERSNVYQNGVRNAEREFSQMADGVEVDSGLMDVNAEYIEEVLGRLVELAQLQGNSEVIPMVEGIQNTLQRDRAGTIPDTGASESEADRLFAQAEEVLETCESTTFGRLELLSCDTSFEDIASEGMLEDTIQKPTIASNDEIVNSMAKVLAEDGIEGGTPEMDTEDIAKAIGVGGEVSGVDFLSSAAATVFPFVNFMFMMNIFENVLHSAVTSVMHALNAGLKETMQALEKLSKQEALQFNSTINIIESK
eukprot:Nk52_evm1s109 gene=Nk52_evmTU1s109